MTHSLQLAFSLNFTGGCTLIGLGGICLHVFHDPSSDMNVTIKAEWKDCLKLPKYYPNRNLKVRHYQGHAQHVVSRYMSGACYSLGELSKFVQSECSIHVICKTTSCHIHSPCFIMHIAIHVHGGGCMKSTCLCLICFVLSIFRTIQQQCILQVRRVIMV